MADERVFIRLTPENLITVALLSAVSFFGLIGARQIYNIIKAKTGDTTSPDDAPDQPKVDDRVAE